MRKDFPIREPLRIVPVRADMVRRLEMVTVLSLPGWLPGQFARDRKHGTPRHRSGCDFRFRVWPGLGVEPGPRRHPMTRNAAVGSAPCGRDSPRRPPRRVDHGDRLGSGRRRLAGGCLAGTGRRSAAQDATNHVTATRAAARATSTSPSPSASRTPSTSQAASRATPPARSRAASRTQPVQTLPDGETAAPLRPARRGEGVL